MKTGYDYVGSDCTLNGQPATIVGRKNGFATVATLDAASRVDYAWPTVARIMQRDGRFHT